MADLETEDSEEQPLYPRIPGREKYTDNNTTKLSQLLTGFTHIQILDQAL